MKRILSIFEDEESSNLNPLALTKPVFQLRCGITTLEEKIIDLYQPERILYFCRDHLESILKKKSQGVKVNDLAALGEENFLLINGRLLVAQEKNFPPLEGREEVGKAKDTMLYARVNRETTSKIRAKNLSDFLSQLKDLVPVKEIGLPLIKYPWDLINYNGKALLSDFQRKGKSGIEGFLDERVVIYGEKKNLFVGKNSEVEANITLDLREGPLYIGEDVKIKPPTIIEGPAYIGDGTIIDGAKIRPGVSIGPVCRIAGELEETIIHGYSNKHHTGFLGHSYIGEWVNIGAMATNSDLKNNYGKVKVYINNALIDSGEIKVGCFIADHTKLGIGILINTGTVIGVSSNIFGSGIPPKNIPSFVWGGASGLVEYDLEKAIENSKTVMGRRKMVQSEEDRVLFREIFQQTKKDREARSIS